MMGQFSSASSSLLSHQVRFSPNLEKFTYSIILSYSEFSGLHRFTFRDLSWIIEQGYMHRVLPAFCASPPAVLRPLARKALKVLDEERFFCANGEVLRG